jgi:hypothetical protein
LRLKCFFDLLEDALVDPVAKPAIDAIPIAEVRRQTTPSTTVFGYVLEGLKKKEVVQRHRINLQ